MYFIEKSYISPRPFLRWKKENKINKKIRNGYSGEQLFALLSENGDHIFTKQELKEILVKEQGGVCCYCGMAIKADYKTTIEHLKPKSTHPKLALDYFNLLASCHGCSQIVLHTKSNNESIESIAKQYNVTVGQLEEIYVETPIETIRAYCKEFYDFENIPDGQKILISPILSNDLHCDSAKDNKEINISPLDKDCYDFFRFKKITGEVIYNPAAEKRAEVKDAIVKLGLNNKLLKRNRLDVINATVLQFQLLKQISGDDSQELLTNTRKLIDNLKQKKEVDKNYSPFFFVKTQIFEGK